MEKTCFSIFAIGVALSVVAVVPARAGIVSSSATFTETCPVCDLSVPPATAVDAMEVFIETPGVTFQSPGLNVVQADWSPSDWLENDVNPGYSNASGSAMSSFNYYLNFNIDDTILPANATIGVDVYYFDTIGGIETLVDDAGLTYDTSSFPLQFDTSVNNWGVGAVLNAQGLAGENTTPEPSTLFLIGGGLLALGGKTLKRKLSPR